MSIDKFPTLAEVNKADAEQLETSGGEGGFEPPVPVLASTTV